MYLYSDCLYVIGNRAPAMVPMKGVYMVSDIQRLARHFQVPLKQPEVSSINI